MKSAVQHWNQIYTSKSDSELGWFERDAAQTLKFLDVLPSLQDQTVFLPGAGTSVLVDELLSRGARLILNDISDEALLTLKQRIGDPPQSIRLHHDISKPISETLTLAMCGSIEPCCIFCWMNTI